MAHNKAALLACLFCLVLGVFVSVSQTQAAPSNIVQKVIFSPFPQGLAAKLVNRQWRREKDYADYVKNLDMVPDYMLGLADLNGDGKAEIFARHADAELGFCDSASYACRMHIYVYTNKKLIEIGKFMAAEPVLVLNTKTKNVSDLLIMDSGHVKKTYVWNGQRYVPK